MSGKGLRSIKHEKCRISGILFCVVLVFSIYVGYVGVMNDLFGHDFIQAFSLMSQVHSQDDFRFAVGDTMIVSTRIRSSNFYRLNIYDNSDCLVFEEVGVANDSDLDISVPIGPTVFNASQIYNLTFSVGFVNFPLMGISALDSTAGPFKVVKSSTKLNLTASYNPTTHELQATAMLSTNDNVPVENRNVSLFMQPDLDVSRNNKGWVYLSKETTDENGAAQFDVAVNGRGGAYGLEARFEGDDDFGSSVSLNATRFVQVSPVPFLSVAKIEKVADAVSVLFRVTDSGNFPLGGRLLSYEPLSLRGERLYVISNDTGYASVTFKINSSLSVVDSRVSVLGDGYTSSFQVRDSLNLNGSEPSFNKLGSGNLPAATESQASNAGEGGTAEIACMLLEYEPLYVFLDQNPARADLPETVNVVFASFVHWAGVQFHFYQNGSRLLASVGAHYRRVRCFPEDDFYEYSQTLVWDPDYYGGCNLIVNATNGGGLLVAQGSSGSFVIDPAPVNLVVYYPPSFCGSALNFSVALSRSIVYQQENSSFFLTSDLAPSLQWVGDTYMIDFGEGNCSVEVFLNNSRAQVVTDGQGLAEVQGDLTAWGSNGCLNITAHINGTTRFQEHMISQIFNLTQVNVSDVASGEGNFTVEYALGISEDVERTYLNVSNFVSVKASLSGFPVYNVSTSVITGRLLSRSATNSSGWPDPIPSGCNYIRVESACLLQAGMASPLLDINHDGVVNHKDSLAVISKVSGLGDQRFDWRCDVNGDNKIDQTDIDIVLLDFNHHVAYLTAGNSTGSYTANYDFSWVTVDFYVGQTQTSGTLDSLGFVAVPVGAQRLNMSIGGIVEYYMMDSARNGSTDNLGVTDIDWCWTTEGVYVVQAKLPPTFNVTVTYAPYATQVEAPLKTAGYFYVLKRPVDFGIDLQCNVSSTLPASPVPIVVTAVDHATRQTVPNLQVQINASDGYSSSTTTNESGIAYVSWQPTSNWLYNISASNNAVGNYVASFGSSLYDFRWNTTLTSAYGNIVDAIAGTNKTVVFQLKNGTHYLIGMFVSFYINGTSYDNTTQTYTSHSGSYNGTTYGIGFATFTWSVPSGEGTYSVQAWFHGNDTFCPSEASMALNVSSISLGVLFSVTPTEFEPNAAVLLNATIIDASSNTILKSQNVTVTFTRFGSDGSTYVLGNASTNYSGVATLNVVYPNNAKAYAYKVDVVPDYNGSSLRQGIISSPVQLTVAANMTLLLDVRRDNFSSKHLIKGRLRSDGVGVGGKSIVISINGTSMLTVSTNSSGYFTCECDLQPRGAYGQPSSETVTYLIQASFAGDGPVNATAYANALDGTNYSACTTVQWGNKPCSNSTILTVAPRSTQSIMSTKSPEEMQQEAEQEGTLHTRHDFSLFFPWYRIHFISVYEGVEQYDQGMSPLPFVYPTLTCSNTFLQILNTLWSVAVWPTAVAVAGAEFFGLIASNAGPEWFAIAMLTSLALKTGSLYVNWNSIGGLAGALIGCIFSTVIGLLKWSFQLIADFLKLIMGVINIAQFGFGNLYRICSFPISIQFGAMTMKRLHELGAVA